MLRLGCPEASGFVGYDSFVRATGARAYALLLPACFDVLIANAKAPRERGYWIVVYVRDLVAGAGFEPAAFRL